MMNYMEASKLVEKAIATMPIEKKEKLEKQERRNCHFTSEPKFTELELEIMENGYYFKLIGLRAKYNFYVDSNFNHMNKPRNANVIEVVNTQVFYQ